MTLVGIRYSPGGSDVGMSYYEDGAVSGDSPFYGNGYNYKWWVVNNVATGKTTCGIGATASSLVLSRTFDTGSHGTTPLDFVAIVGDEGLVKRTEAYKLTVSVEPTVSANAPNCNISPRGYTLEKEVDTSSHRKESWLIREASRNAGSSAKISCDVSAGTGGAPVVFRRWSDGVVNWYRTIENLTSDTSLVGYFSYVYSITFRANGGSGSNTTQGGIAYESEAKLNANPFLREGYAFVGWSLDSSSSFAQFADGSSADAVFNAAGASAGATITLYAVWVSVKIRKRGTGDDLSEDLDDVGSLVVKSSEDGYDLAIPLTQITETVSGVLRKAWVFAPQPNTSYRVSCELGTDAPDKFWAFSPPADIETGGTLENKVVYCDFSRKALKQVTTGTQPEAGSIAPEEMVATLAITTPSEPDSHGAYIVGQQIVATAQYPDGMMGWKLVNAILEIGGVSSTPIPNYIVGDSINVPASNFTDTMHIIGVFGRINCEVDAKADDASANAASGVDVKRYSSVDGDWIHATSAKYGETVRVYATVNASLGYELDGIYANGEKIADSLLPDGYVECVVRGETHFVVKAKVRVSLGVGHWNVEDGTWTDGDCSVTASVDGVEIESPADGFDVILGQTVAYEVDIRGGWHFDAWFAGTEAEKPESFDDPVDLPISETEFVPTKPIAVIARVTDEIIEYRTTVGFANNDNPQAVVDIPADVANVTSFPEADDVGTSQDKVVLTYSSGTKPVTLTFAESVGSLYFEKLQEYVRDEWKDVETAGTEYPMLTSKNRTLRALYTTAGVRTVKVEYANIPNVSPGTEDRVCGEIGIVESNYPEGNPDGKTFVGNRGTSFTLRVIAKNGWRFVGWFYDPAHIGVPKYAGTETVVSVISTRTLYAYFEPDTHAVYEWEGRNENKMMTWRSKVYVSPVPFNPSGMRVDATDSRGRGKSIARVEVGMMSSPDAVPAQSGLTVLTNMPNHVARRLPKRRPERYMYVEVQNDAEVDRVIVGTSMEGLKV